METKPCQDKLREAVLEEGGRREYRQVGGKWREDEGEREARVETRVVDEKYKKSNTGGRGRGGGRGGEPFGSLIASCSA